MKKIVLCGFTAIVSSMLCAQDFPLTETAVEIQEESNIALLNINKGSVLDQPRVDSWYGFGACYQLWQDIKNWGGFSRSNQAIFEGVVVSDESDSKEALLAESAEGTIRVLDDLIVQYKTASTSPEYSEEEQLEAALYVEDLQKDHDILLENQIIDENDTKEVLLVEATDGTICILDDLVVQEASTSPEYATEEQLIDENN